ncbi:PEP-CTERM sorting domain-containing protein [Salinisphaera sp. SWV1]|uniref:PEP-CTERM sorting domain-containing protein n=1 Tax=Salinisphaera sp. SWV1 TaxID=3454139 RepID=UPI003F82C4A8
MSFFRYTCCSVAISTFTAFTSAHAAYLGYGSQLDADGVPTSRVAAATRIDFNDASNLCDPASCDSTAIYANDGSFRQSYRPTGDNTVFASVSPSYSPASPAAKLDLQSSNNYFGLYWGSLNAGDTITFRYNDTSVASFNGTAIAGATDDSLYVNFFDLPTFNAVEFRNNNNFSNSDLGDYLNWSNFAFDNVAYGNVADVPEPGSLAMFGLGLLFMVGRIGLRRRYRQPGF